MVNEVGNRKRLPRKGMQWDTIAAALDQMKHQDIDWRGGRLTSYTYFFNDDVLAKQIEAYGKYMVENGLGAGLAFKSLSTMLTDIYDMGSQLFHAPQGAGTSFTSGGTESVFQAVKTCRDQARSLRGEPLGHYNIVAATTAHPCLDKAAQVLDIEVRRLPIDNEYRASAHAMAPAIDDRTIMLYSSAPCYPFGVFDRISELSQLALERALWLHVDACWGGFISPFASRLGYSLPEWDMQLPGVTSLSADLHKFGYCAKGASLVIYRDRAVQKYEEFSFSDWPRGTYWTPTMSGSKAAGSISTAWAMMQYLGEEGYERATAETMKATMGMIAGLNDVEGLAVLKPYGESNIFNLVSVDPAIDIMAVADILDEKGWMRGRMREPLAIHQGVTPAHLPIVDEYVGEMRNAVQTVLRTRKVGRFNERTY